MTDFYQFSQSSLELLEECIAAASNRGTKWIELFKPDTKDVSVTQKDIPIYYDENTIVYNLNCDDEVVQDAEEPEPKESDLKQIERIGANLETTPNKLDYLTEQYNYEHLLPAVAENITLECLEHICDNLIKTRNVQHEKILLHFIPAYIKRKPSSEALSVLMQAYRTNPDTVITLIESLFLNMDIPNKILEEFFIAINVKARSQFLNALLVIELPTDVFVHRLNSISYFYKNCTKTFEIHSSVLNGLLQCGQHCENDKNYGRFLLTFFQGLNDEYAKISRLSLEQLLDLHKTSFKRPCEAILHKFYNK